MTDVLLLELAHRIKSSRTLETPVVHGKSEDLSDFRSGYGCRIDCRGSGCSGKCGITRGASVCFSVMQKVMHHAKVEIHVEAGEIGTGRLVSGENSRIPVC